MRLKLEAVTFTYPGTSTAVLQDFDLQVEGGESVALMGPSGRGKSTALGVAGLLLHPQSGTVLIDGEAVGPTDARRLLGSRVAWVLQNANLLPRRSVLDNVALPFLAGGGGRVEASRRGRELLSAVGLASAVDREARTLSGGQAQRVGVARALITDPSVILADEPTANLDRETAMQVSRALFAASARVALVVATHDPEVASLADRTIHLGAA